MTALQEAQNFIKAVLTQQEINRQAHGDADADDLRTPLEWGVIAAEHMGHLLGALRTGDPQLTEKEILHVAGPLLECFNSMKTRIKQSKLQKCANCGEVFRLATPSASCPVCEGRLIQIGDGS